MAKSQRDKGARRERQLVNRLSELFPDAARNLTETRDGRTGIDLTGTGNLRIQVKSWKVHCPISALDEVEAGDAIPALVSWPDRDEPVICLRLADFERVLADVGVVWE